MSALDQLGNAIPILLAAMVVKDVYPCLKLLNTPIVDPPFNH
jgi:hypothetical protein